MKKFFYSVLAVVFAALTFTSCDDVPMPYAQPEVNGGGTTYEGAEGDGTLDNPYNVAGVLQFISTLESGVESTEDVYISGKVVSIAESNGIVQNYDTSGYGSATFDITDGTNTFTIYRAYYLNNQKWTTGAGDPVKIGDDVIICGKVYLYNGKTPETVSNKAYLYKLNDKTSTGGGGGSSGTATGDGTLQNPYNPTAANKLASSLGWKTTTEYETSDNVYIKGKISSIKETYTANATNGNATFYISEDGKEESDQFQCYRVLYLGNKKYTSGTDIKKGDEVIIYGKLMNFRGNTPETVQNQAYLYSLNGTTEGGGESGGGDTPGGDTGTAMTKSVDGLVVTFTNPNATAGESVTYDLTTCGLDHQAENPSFTLNNVSFAFAQGDGSTTPKYWKTGNYDEFRMYAKNVLTIVGTANIASIVFQCVNNNGNPAVGNEQAYATVNGKTLTFVNDWTSTSSGTQFRFKSVTITYAK
ncbi:MAG: hypothetical protein IJJ68_03870 [Prevotella sp.]|nr:hypothetical protein [Prevotella sp.]